MKEFNPHSWSIKDEIQKRANLESLVEWSKSPPIPTPKYIPEKSKRSKLIDFLKSFLV